MRLFLFSCIYTFSISLSGQNFSLDSLQAMEDEELLELLVEVESDSTNAEKVARVYLNRAKAQKDTIKMARGYDRLARIFSPEQNIRYADSIIILTEKGTNPYYPVMGYILKGFWYGEEQLIESTKNYLLAYKEAKKRGNLPEQLYASDMLVFAKSVWGDKNEALMMSHANYSLLKSKEFRESMKISTRKALIGEIDNYLLDLKINQMQTFAFCHYKLNQLDSTYHYIELGEELIKTSNREEVKFQQWFHELSMEVLYAESRYAASISKGDLLLTDYKESVPLNSRRNILLFRGLAQQKLGDTVSAIKSLIKSDSLYELNDRGITQPYQRKLFEELRRHYSRNNNIDRELEYISKLMRVDSIIIENYKYFEPEIITNFETPLLLQRKENLIKNLETKQANHKFYLYSVVFGLVISLLLLFYYIHRQRVFRQRFLKLQNKDISVNFNSSRIQDAVIQIPDDIIALLLERLRKFEDTHGFVQSGISLNSLSKNFDSNPRYLSRVINLKKDKSFPQYLNDLRTAYAMDRLKNDLKFRNYTIKAIAQECGFNRAESFSKAFYKQFGIYPSFYIKQLQKDSA